MKEGLWAHCIKISLCFKHINNINFVIIILVLCAHCARNTVPTHSTGMDSIQYPLLYRRGDIRKSHEYCTHYCTVHSTVHLYPTLCTNNNLLLVEIDFEDRSGVAQCRVLYCSTVLQHYSRKQRAPLRPIQVQVQLNLAVDNTVQY